MNANFQAVNIGDFHSPHFPYALPLDLPENYAYPSDETEEPICFCFFCQKLQPCSFVKRVLRTQGYTAETDWRLVD